MTHLLRLTYKGTCRTLKVRKTRRKPDHRLRHSHSTKKQKQTIGTRHPPAVHCKSAHCAHLIDVCLFCDSPSFLVAGLRDFSEALLRWFPPPTIFEVQDLKNVPEEEFPRRVMRDSDHHNLKLLCFGVGSDRCSLPPLSRDMLILVSKFLTLDNVSLASLVRDSIEKYEMISDW